MVKVNQTFSSRYLKYVLLLISYILTCDQKETLLTIVSLKMNEVAKKLSFHDKIFVELKEIKVTLCSSIVLWFLPLFSILTPISFNLFRLKQWKDPNLIFFFFQKSKVRISQLDSDLIEYSKRIFINIHRLFVSMLFPFSQKKKVN